MATLVLAGCSQPEASVQTPEPTINLYDQPSEMSEGEIYLNGFRITKAQNVYDNPVVIEPVILLDNPEAQNVSLADINSFLFLTRPKRDDMNKDTDYKFHHGESYYTCGYYAEEVHNDAEALGIRASIAILKMQDGVFHAVNAFETTDKGLIYVDGSYYSDRLFEALVVGQEYEVFGMFHIIEEIVIFWEGYQSTKGN